MCLFFKPKITMSMYFSSLVCEEIPARRLVFSPQLHRATSVRPVQAAAPMRRSHRWQRLQANFVLNTEYESIEQGVLDSRLVRTRRARGRATVSTCRILFVARFVTSAHA
jgi:hypothetical protein